MKTPLVLATTVASSVLAPVVLTLCLMAPAASAQNPAGINAPKYGIAVVDINYIFKKDARFLASMEAIQKDMMGVNESLNSRRTEIAKAEQEKETFNVGSPEFKQRDEAVAEMKAQFQLDVNKQRRDILEREAKVYYETYTRVTQAIGYYAKQKNIALVMRFIGEEPDPNRREEIIASINKDVHFQNQIDITPDVLAMLNQAVGARPTAGAQ